MILFPTSADSIAPGADAIYFMSVMNSRDPEMIVREQARGALVLKRSGIEPIGMGYIIVEPGMKVGEVGKVAPVPQNGINIAIGYALAAEFFGMKLVYLEAGSGAPTPVPVDMIRAVKAELSIPLIVGGGIRDPDIAAEISRAGADIIVTGTVVESAVDIGSTLRDIIDAIRGV